MPLVEYGKSVLGSPLRYIPCMGECRMLVFAGIHGEEPETTFLLSRCLRAFDSPFEHVAFILCANPDAMTLGTRCNFNGVDLNRNFPTSNWRSGDVRSRSILEAPQDTVLSAGDASPEPEVRFLLKLIRKLDPQEVLTLHAPLGCVDAPVRTPLVRHLCESFLLPWVPDIGYDTPGSFGTWCKENSLECVTLELPRLSLEALFERYGESFIDFLKSVR